MHTAAPVGPVVAASTEHCWNGNWEYNRLPHCYSVHHKSHCPGNETRHLRPRASIRTWPHFRIKGTASAEGSRDKCSLSALHSVYISVGLASFCFPSFLHQKVRSGLLQQCVESGTSFFRTSDRQLNCQTARARAHTHTHTHTKPPHIHTHTPTHTPHTRTHTHARAHTHPHARPHTHPRARARTHTHTPNRLPNTRKQMFLARNTLRQTVLLHVLCNPTQALFTL